MVGEGTLVVCAYRDSVAYQGKHRKCEFVLTLLFLFIGTVYQVCQGLHFHTTDETRGGY